MARIEQVKVRRGPFHTASSPIVIEAYALLIDRKTGRYYAQVKFVNVCESTISSVIVAVTASTLGSPVEATHIYPAINLSPGAAHGSQEAVPLGDAQATDIKVSVRCVELTDGAKWEATADAEWSPLPARKPLEDLEAPSSCLGMYRSVFSSAKYVPWAMDEIWQCSCGTLNPIGHSVCSGCGYLKTDIMAAANADSLIAAERHWKTIRIKQVILALAELAEKRAAEEELARKKEEAARIEAERKAEHEKQLAEEKAARDAKNLAEARELIAEDGEEQLNRAIQILKLVPKRASEKSLAEAKTKLEALAVLKEKRRKKRIIVIVALVVAIVCSPFAFGVIQDQIAVSDRLKPDATTTSLKLSIDNFEFNTLMVEPLRKGSNGQELNGQEIRLFLQNDYNNDTIFEQLFSSVYPDGMANSNGVQTTVFLGVGGSSIEVLDSDQNKYTIRVSSCDYSIVKEGTGPYGAIIYDGCITYTVDMYFGVPNSSSFILANPQVVSNKLSRSV